ncbi:GAF domain-containing sensor histidine kinase [soil metagenome]
MVFEGEVDKDITALARIPAVQSILDVVCRTTGMGFAAVARVTENKWIVCSVRDSIDFGLPVGGELKVETTICQEIRRHRQPVIISDVENSPYFDHATPAMYGFKSYISAPIFLPDGRFFGTLCAIDPRPARLDDPEVIGMFELFAELIAFHIDVIDRMALSEANLSSEREMSALREQFIAVLGHDLRNPLAAIDAGVQTLQRETLSARGTSVISLINGAVGRMSKLIDDVVDFARTRFGDGMVISRSPVALEPVVRHVIGELQAVHPDRIITSDITALGNIPCDPARLAQLFSNLIANAITHGRAEAPVHVRAEIADDIFEFSVENAGDQIPAEAMKRLFAPFARGDIRPGHEGLGLGLYIASEVTRAHDGELTVTSTEDVTRFTFKMPVAG